jgi:prepilin-type N-terminal cleavage/methylation domain-containing protein
MMKMLKKGFTLIELLVVIGIIGVLAAFVLSNMTGARARARDAKAKTELASVKTALGLYNSIYGQYPATGNGLVFNACGPNGTSACPYSGCGADFTVGGGGCNTVLMQTLTRAGSYFFFKYYPCNSGNDYRMKITLENASDAQIADSQAKCPAASCSLGTYATTDYVVCP